MFSGNNIRSDSQEFKGEEVIAIFGGAEINLRHISISDKTHLELICIFGGITVFTLEHIKVEVSGMLIFGG